MQSLLVVHRRYEGSCVPVLRLYFSRGIFLMIFLSSFLGVNQQANARDNRTTALLKVSERSGFFGLGSARFISITLSTVTRDTTISAENVNDGSYYHFLVTAAGDWAIDRNFMLEELSKLTITQGNKVFRIETQDSAVNGHDDTSALIGFSKQLKLYEVFAFTFPLSEVMATATMNVPLEYWPGYSKVIRYTDDADRALREHNYVSAITKCNTIVSDESLAFFPQFQKAKEKRLLAFHDHFYESYSSLIDMFVHDTTTLKQKIQKTSDALAVFRFVADSLVAESLKIFATDSVVEPLYVKAKSESRQTEHLLDSLRHALDDQNTRWIILGDSKGSRGYRYRYMIEALVQSFLSIDFADTAAKELQVTLPASSVAMLTKFNLMESFETFVRISNERRKNRTPLFSPEFLANLRTDSLDFPLPYYSALMALNEFCSGAYADAEKEILVGMKRSFDEELTSRLDELRIQIKSFQNFTPMEVTTKMNEGMKFEKRGEYVDATAYYNEVRMMAENYTPAVLALGKLYQHRGDTYRANNFFLKAIETDPLYYSAYEQIFKNSTKTGNFDALIDLLAQVMKRGNDFYLTHYYLSIALNSMGKHAEALKASLVAIGLNGNSIRAHLEAGKAYQGMKNLAKARECFNRAAQIDPESQDVIECLKQLDADSKSNPG